MLQPTIDDLLASDDELPSDYEEDPEVPAYQNDRRFDAINFNWIDSNFSKYYTKEKYKGKVLLSSLYSKLNEDVIHDKTDKLKKGEKSMIFKGVLCQQDIFCLKCIEPLTSDATFLWFISFLTYKDMQSNYSFLKSCLVEAIQKINQSPKTDVRYGESKKYKFDIAIKK